MPEKKIQLRRSLLQRRKSLTSTFQAMLDGAIVLLTMYFSFINAKGFISPLDAIFMVILLAMMGIIYDQMSIYRRFGGFLRSSKKLLLSWSLSFFITVFLFVVTQFFYEIPQSSLLAIYLIGFSGQLLNRWLFLLLGAGSSRAEKIDSKSIIIGCSPLALHLYNSINNNPFIRETVVGRIQTKNKTNLDNIPVLGEMSDINQILDQQKIKTVYIAVPLSESHRIEEIYDNLVNHNVNIHWAPNIFSLNLINHSVKEIAGTPILTLSESPLIGNYLLFKAIEDRTIAFISLILFSPLMLLVALWVKLESPGPVIFKQQRTGWDGEIFYIWKFRSMKMHQEIEGKVKQATADDDRFTRSGRFIRKTSIDELPQLFNVLAGTMSLVGPRPHAVQHNVMYSKRINAYLARHRIKPGITGLAQIHGFRGETETDEKMEQRVHYDMQYINSWSFWLDLVILIKTIPALLKDKAY